MSNQCDCGDPECAICGGRPRGGKAPVLDAFMQQKAQEDAARKAAIKTAAQALSNATPPAVPAAPTVPVVQLQERPIVAQLADAWQPPAHLQEETQRLLNTPLPPPPTQEQVAQREQEVAALVGAPVSAPAQRKPKSPFALAYAQWQQECVKRNEWIAAQYREFQARQRARAEALAGWDAHVAAAKLAWEQAKATLPPPAPRKETFAG